jgi:hypothetical protein
LAVRIVHDHAGHLCCFRHGEGSTLFPQYLLPEFMFEQRFGPAGMSYLERVRRLTGR